MIQPFRTIFLFVLLLALLPAVDSQGAGNAPAAAARHRILVLDTYQTGLPIPESIDRGILAALREGGFSVGNVFMEHLDFARAPSDEHRVNLVNLLRSKLADKHIDVVISIGATATEFMVREGKSLFPDAAVLALISPNYQTLSSIYDRVMNIPWQVDPAGTLRTALDLFPKTRQVFVVTGANDRILPFLDQAKKAFAPWQGKLQIEFSNEMTYDEMLRRVAALPPDAIVIYSPFFTDTTGRAFVPAEVVVKVCQASTVPVFATLKQYLGSGIVGGSLLKTEDVGRQAGKVSLDYLDGRLKLTQPVTTFDTAPLPEFDWRVLERWKADSSRLPKESVFINRPATLWGQYKAAVVIATTAILAMATLVVALLILNRRLRGMTITANNSEATFRKLFEDSSDAILLIDAAGVFVESNQATLDLLKMTREQFLLLSPARISPEFQPDGRCSAEAAPEMIALAYSRGLHRFDWTCVNAEGDEFIVEVSLMPVTIKGQTMLHATWRDITLRKRAEEERIKLEGQLLQAQKTESVGRLAGGVAHDFNNMLSVILGHAELGLMHLDPAHPVCADLKEISKTAERSADLTRQLLTFARKQTVMPRIIDLNDTVTNMLKMLQRLIGENINLSWQPSSELCQVKMDPSQVDQILANLCVNARDAIEDTGRITIETGTCTIDADYCAANPEAAPGDYVRLVVSDSGKGMDRETQSHIFEPFYTTKELGKGTGLGLATVYGAVKQNNGFINIYSEPGQGTTFSIHLPRNTDTGTARRAQTDAEIAVPRGQETILLVEDESAILNITSLMLEKQGYTVLKASTHGEAMQLIRDHVGSIHLLMTDVIMPEMNGRELAGNILALHPAMKRLFMSGYTADVIAHHGVLDEGVHFIQKPFSLPNMAATVREVLDGN